MNVLRELVGAATLTRGTQNLFLTQPILLSFAHDSLP